MTSHWRERTGYEPLDFFDETSERETAGYEPLDLFHEPLQRETIGYEPLGFSLHPCLHQYPVDCLGSSEGPNLNLTGVPRS